MAQPPQTDEGWFVLHDLRRVDWDAWRAASERARDRAVSEGVDHLETYEAVADADEGVSAVCSVLGEKADLMFVHFRPTLDHLSAAERRFESTALAEFTERASSYVSVTEVSGYVSTDYFEDDAEETDEGLRRYIESKLHPDVPDGEYVCFYPMSKRRGETVNWYTLDFEERADLMAGHGEVGREFAGRIKQVIASSVGLDDHEWGVTLFGGDPTDIKDVVYEMRFDEASARYGEFGRFYVGRRFPPADLGAYLDGAVVPTDADAAEPAAASDAHAGNEDRTGEGGDDGDADDAGGPPPGATVAGDEDDVRGALADLDVYAGQPHGEDVHATVVYSAADAATLFDAVSGLRGNFDHYDTHVRTAVYGARDGSRSAAVSLWETASAAETAAGFLSDLPDVIERAGEESGFGTMGMFYTIEPEHRGAFLDRFDEVTDLLDGMDGHVETDLMINHEDENDTFVASGWRSREDAMAFFRSEAFRDAVDWGRDVLADRPRHVFLS
jgi:chlorite dismutase